MKLEHIIEPCGNEMDVDMCAMVSFHAPYYRVETLQSAVKSNRYIKRTFCDTCATYWDKEYKEVKSNE